MSVTVTELGPFERMLTMRFAKAPLDRARTRAARRLSRHLDINGFRRGRAPRRMVENLVGRERIDREAIEDLVESRLPGALAETELYPVAAPSLEKVRATAGQGLEVGLRISLWPTLDRPPEYRGRRFEIDHPYPVVEEDDIRLYLDGYREQFAELETVERPAASEDYVVVDLRAEHDGRRIEGLEVSDYIYEMGSEDLIEGMDAELVGRSADDIVHFSGRLGEGADVDLAVGTEIDARVLVREVKEKRLPELDDDWVYDFTEFDTVEEMRENIAREIENRSYHRSRELFRARVVTRLTDEIEIDIPQAVIDAGASRELDRFRNVLERVGSDLDSHLAEMEQDRASFFDELRGRTLKEVRTRVMLESVARDVDLRVDREELMQVYERAALQRNVTVEELSERMAGSFEEMDILGGILRSKALQVLMHAVVATDSDGNVVDLRFDPPDPAGVAEDETEQGDQ